MAATLSPRLAGKQMPVRVEPEGRVDEDNDDVDDQDDIEEYGAELSFLIEKSMSLEPPMPSHMPYIF